MKLEDRAATLLDQAADGEHMDTNAVRRVAWQMNMADRELFMRDLHDAQIAWLRSKVPTSCASLTRGTRTKSRKVTDPEPLPKFLRRRAL